MGMSEHKLNYGKPQVSDLMSIDVNDDEFQNLIWGEHMHLRDQMPSEWKRSWKDSYSPYIMLKVKVATNDESIRPLAIHLTATNLKKAHSLPPRFDSGKEFDIWEEAATTKIQALIKQYRESTEMADKWRKIQAQVIAFLDSAKSLNAAIKAWPDLRAFIPQEYLARVDAKPERKAAAAKVEQALATVDRDLAITSAALVKLAAL
jgi:hypothetical protein